MILPSNTPIFDFQSEKLGNIKIRRLNGEIYAEIYDAFPDIESVDAEKIVRFLFAHVGYWPDSLNDKDEFQEQGSVGKENTDKLTNNELEKFAEQFIDKDENIPYSRFTIASKKQEDDELERKKDESSVEYLHRIIVVKAKENNTAYKKMLKAAMPLSIDEIFPKSSLDSIKGTLTASEQLMEQVEKMKSWYDPADFKIPKSTLDSLNDTLAHADHFKDLVETTQALNESHRVNHEPPFVNDLHFTIPPNPIEGTNKRLDSLLDHQKEAVKLTAKSANLLTKMNDSFLRLIGDLRLGGRNTLVVAGLTLFVTLCSLTYVIYATKQSSASSVVMIESMKTLNTGMTKFLGQQNDIIEELRNQNGNDATRQKMLSQLIEINKDMSEVMKKSNAKPDHQVQPPIQGKTN